MATEPVTSSTRPWPIKPWCLHASWLAALIAILLSLSSPAVTVLRHDHAPGLWVVAPFLAIMYGFLLAFVYGMAFIARDMPPSSMMGSITPESVGKVLDAIYGAMPNIALILFPVFMIKFSLFVLVAVIMS